MRTTRKVNEQELKEAKEIGEPFVREYEEGDFCELEGTCSRVRLNKLGQLEDIEDEIGIDLITLYKAFKNGIWSKGGELGGECCLENEPKFVRPKEIELGTDWYLEEAHKNDAEFSLTEEDTLCLYTHEYEDTIYEVRVKDYGRTWALTKEELK